MKICVTNLFGLDDNIIIIIIIEADLVMEKIETQTFGLMSEVIQYTKVFIRVLEY